MQKRYKFLLVAIMILLFGATSIWYTGFQAQKNYQHLLERFNQQTSNGLELIPLSFNNALFSGKAKTALLISSKLLGKQPLRLEIDTQMRYLPFYAKGHSIVRVTDPKLSQSIKALFGTETPLTMDETFTLPSSYHNQWQLQPIKWVQTTQGTSLQLNSTPLMGSLSIDLQSGQYQSNSGLDHIQFSSSDLNASLQGIRSQSSGIFGKHLNSSVDLDEFKLTTVKEVVQLQNFTINISNTLNPQRRLSSDLSIDLPSLVLSKSQQKFTNNHLQLILSDLQLPNAEEIEHYRQQLLIATPESLNQLSLKLGMKTLSQGVHLRLQKLHSETPWGPIDSHGDIQVEPFTSTLLPAFIQLYGQSKVQFELSFPQAMQHRPSLSPLISQWSNLGILKADSQKLTLSFSYEKGQTILNGNRLSVPLK